MAAGSAVPRFQLTSERLAAALEQVVSDGARRHAAADLGEKMRSEDGVDRVRLLFR